MVESVTRSDLTDLRTEIKKIILNNGVDKNLSDNPKDAIVSLKADRGTSHRAFIMALDEIQAAYYDIYAERTGMTSGRFRSLDQNDIEELAIYNKARQNIPMNISIAEASIVVRK
jgi:hypothetical protein